jgi:hypothetical protein
VQELHRHRAAQRDVLGLVDHPHAAAAQERIEPVAPVDDGAQARAVIRRRGRPP